MLGRTLQPRLATTTLRVRPGPQQQDAMWFQVICTHLPSATKHDIEVVDERFKKRSEEQRRRRCIRIVAMDTNVDFLPQRGQRDDTTTATATAPPTTATNRTIGATTQPATRRRTMPSTTVAPGKERGASAAQGTQGHAGTQHDRRRHGNFARYLIQTHVACMGFTPTNASHQWRDTCQATTYHPRQQRTRTDDQATAHVPQRERTMEHDSQPRLPRPPDRRRSTRGEGHPEARDDERQGDDDTTRTTPTTIARRQHACRRRQIQDTTTSRRHNHARWTRPGTMRQTPGADILMTTPHEQRQLHEGAGATARRGPERAQPLREGAHSPDGSRESTGVCASDDGSSTRRTLQEKRTSQQRTTCIAPDAHPRTPCHYATCDSQGAKPSTQTSHQIALHPARSAAWMHRGTQTILPSSGLVASQSQAARYAVSLTNLPSQISSDFVAARCRFKAMRTLCAILMVPGAIVDCLLP